MNPRAFVVSRVESGRTVAAVLHARLALSWSVARRLVEGGWVRVGHTVCQDAAQRVKPGQRLEVRRPAERTRDRDARRRPSDQMARPRGDATTPEHKRPAPVIRYADAHVVVVEKPAGMTTMRHAHEAAEFGRRAQRFLPPTLADLLPGLLATAMRPRPRVRAVHRLDKDTSGLVVFAQTPAAERSLGLQFRAHSTGRRYLAVVRGRATPGRIESYFVTDRGDGRRGSSPAPGAGKRAVTNVRVLEQLGDFTLVECRPETGRTHQVRIHLGERGTPICGEQVYDRPPHGPPLPDTSGAPRLALHAAELAFDHPATGKRMTWTSPLPGDLTALVSNLRKRAKGQ